jgi:hypothetical protein
MMMSDRWFFPSQEFLQVILIGVEFLALTRKPSLLE